MDKQKDTQTEVCKDGHMDVQIPPVCYRTSSLLVPIGTVAQKKKKERKKRRMGEKKEKRSDSDGE